MSGVGVVEAGRARVERVVMPDGGSSWTVVRADGVPVEPVDRLLGYLGYLPRSPNTVASYAYDLRGFVDFLDEQPVAWTDVEVDHLARFVRWLEQPAGNVALLAGAEPARAPATVVRLFVSTQGLAD